jgi:hypothetical protein
MNDINNTDSSMLAVSVDTEHIMALTYRGVKYDQVQEADANRSWWNLAHRPWLCLKYRNVCYFPYVTGGQIK